MKHKAKLKSKISIVIAYSPHLPNEFHRKEKWTAGKIHMNKKKYNRKYRLLDNEVI